MNALIDLGKCREYMTVTISGKDHQIRLSGTVYDPYFCGRDICTVLPLRLWVDNSCPSKVWLKVTSSDD